MAGPTTTRHHGEALGDLDDTAIMIKTALAAALSPPETASRSSFSSVRENDDGLAQTFTRSKVSSYTTQAHDDVFDESPCAELPCLSFQPPLTAPHSRLHGFLVPPDTFKGWKQIPIKGKKASRSCEDLHKLHLAWSPPPTPTTERPESSAPGQSPLEKLPSEMLSEMISPAPPPLQCFGRRTWVG